MECQLSLSSLWLSRDFNSVWSGNRLFKTQVLVGVQSSGNQFSGQRQEKRGLQSSLLCEACIVLSSDACSKPCMASSGQHSAGVQAQRGLGVPQWLFGLSDSITDSTRLQKEPSPDSDFTVQPCLPHSIRSSCSRRR